MRKFTPSHRISVATQIASEIRQALGMRVTSCGRVGGLARVSAWFGVRGFLLAVEKDGRGERSLRRERADTRVLW